MRKNSPELLVVPVFVVRLRRYDAVMPWGLKRFQETRCLHFLTFSCYGRAPLLGKASAREIFEQTLEQTRQWYGFCVSGYVVMPEHVHLLMSEPERAKLSVALQMLKQNVARRLRSPEGGLLWQPRYYDFNVWSDAKRVEKLRYIHRNAVKRAWCTVRRIGRGAAFDIIFLGL
jgi:putative transposase